MITPRAGATSGDVVAGETILACGEALPVLDKKRHIGAAWPAEPLAVISKMLLHNDPSKVGPEDRCFYSW